ncbi:MAG: N-acyl homoserine lactonase family protein [Chloroflexota bacterium]
MGLVLHPLHVGTIQVDKSLFLTLHNYGEKILAPVTMWYIEGANANIIVDTGAPSQAEAPRTVPSYYEQTPEQHITKALASVGMRPEEIDIVILTHLHWDHCTNVQHFPKARYVIQRTELQYAAAPLPLHIRPYGGRWPGTKAFLPEEAIVQVVEGDREITRGVCVRHLPGHTPGMQGVTVETDGGGTYLIASDNVPLYDNWEGEPPFVPHIPNTLHVDLKEYFASFARMEQLADSVLPSHDFRVLENRQYPAQAAR